MYINAMFVTITCIRAPCTLMLDTFPASEKPQETPSKRQLEEDEVGMPKAKRRRGDTTPKSY